jgi:ABC-type xylose transport system substrate-binding protein
MLTAMFSGRHELQTNDDSEVFIDRDGTHFGQILNLLRNANVEMAARDRMAFEAELDFYGITEARERLAYAHR